LFKNISDKCLDQADKKFYTGLLLWKCHGGNNQQFKIIKKDFNIYQLIVYGECLNIRDNNLGNNAPVGFEACKEGEKYQLWRAIQV